MEQIILKGVQADVFNSKARHVGYFGSIASGKSTVACLKGIVLSLSNPYNTGVIIRNTVPQLRTSIQRIFLDLVDKYYKKYEFSRNMNENWIKFKNGSMVYFMHTDDPSLYKGPEFGWAMIDQAEDLLEDIADKITTRVRKPGTSQQTYWLGNTDRGHNWCYRWFKLGEKPGSILYETSIYDNMHNLTKEYIDELFSKPKEWQDIWLFGSWDSPGGLIFPTTSMHWVDITRPNDDWWMYISGDPPDSTGYFGALLGGLDYDGNIFICEEYYQDRQMIKFHAERIKSLYKEPRMIYFDPAAWKKVQHGDRDFISLVDRYRDFGVYPVPAENSINVGIDMVNDLLMVDKEHKNPFTGQIGSPRLFLNKRCIHLREQMGEWSWANLDVEPIHLVDALRYLVASRPAPPIKREMYQRKYEPLREDAFMQL